MSYCPHFVILHLDDDILELKRFSRLFFKHLSQHKKFVNSQKSLFQIETFQYSAQFLKYLTDAKVVHFCILDIELSSKENCDGLSLIQTIKKQHPYAAIIMSSFHEDSHSILKAMSLSADDFLSKTNTIDNLPEYFVNIYKSMQLKHGILNQNIPEIFHHTPLQIKNKNYVGKTLTTIGIRVSKIIESAIRCILIEGESGTGKEVVADIFEQRLSQTIPFLRINCGALSSSLLESELFGYKKGSFTGALQDKIGLIESASGGFLFLDEVSSLSQNAQILLLRAIENQEIIRIGETYPRKVNVRFICASNLALTELVQHKKFRNDLFQRLCEVEIKLPSLYQRKEEIAELIDFFCENLDSNLKYSIDPLAKKVLCAYDWRNGNVRELRNTLRAMTEFAHNQFLGVWCLPNRIFSNFSFSETSPTCANNANMSVTIMLDNDGMLKTYQELCDELLCQIILKKQKNALKMNFSKIAKELGISRTTLLTKIKKINI